MRERQMAILVTGLLVLAACNNPGSERNRFDRLFPDNLSGRPVQHFYSVEYPNEVDDYPFAGTELPFDLYGLFGPELATSWSDLGFGVYAVGRIGEEYVLRIPGRYTSDQLALYRWEEDGSLHFLATLSSLWCDEGWCNRQDGWLQDLNNDNRLDLVTRFTQIDDKGVPFQEELSAKIREADGSFKTRPDWALNPSDFPLQTTRQ